MVISVIMVNKCDYGYLSNYRGKIFGAFLKSQCSINPLDSISFYLIIYFFEVLKFISRSTGQLL